MKGLVLSGTMAESNERVESAAKSARLTRALNIRRSGAEGAVRAVAQ